MKIYTTEEINALIACPKVITEPPKKEMKIESGHKRNNMELRSGDGNLKFSVFMRINQDFPENYSIGLEFWPEEERGSLCLLRCNGPHGDFVSMSTLPSTHFVPHIHKAKTTNIEAGLRPERGGEPTDKYMTYEQALLFFLQKIRVIDPAAHFPNITQVSLDLHSEVGNELP